MRRRKRWLWVLCALALSGAALYLAGRWMWSEGDDDDQSLVYDRTWMTEMPERETDFLHAFVVLRAHPYGAFYKASSWRVEQEIFEYEARDQTFDVRFPQTGKRGRFRSTLRRCDDHPPFDLCLTLDRNPWGGPTTYYGFEDDEDEDAALGGRLGDLRARLRSSVERRR